MADFSAEKQHESEVQVAPGHFKGRVEWLTDTDDLDAAAVTDTVDLDGLPSDAVQLRCYVVPVVEYAGGSVASCTVQVGNSGDPNGLMTATDVFTGATLGTQQGTQGVLAGVHASSPATTGIIATFTTTTDNCDALTAGSCRITILYDRYTVEA